MAKYTLEADFSMITLPRLDQGRIFHSLSIPEFETCSIYLINFSLHLPPSSESQFFPVVYRCQPPLLYWYTMHTIMDPDRLAQFVLLLLLMRSETRKRASKRSQGTSIKLSRAFRTFTSDENSWPRYCAPSLHFRLTSAPAFVRISRASAHKLVSVHVSLSISMS
jgi:hypothetical protein